MTDDRMRQFVAEVRALVERIRFDDHGQMVGTTFMGGNGGLISQDLLSMTEGVARALDAIEAIYADG